MARNYDQEFMTDLEDESGGPDQLYDRMDQELEFEFESDQEQEFFKWVSGAARNFWKSNPWFRNIARRTATEGINAVRDEGNRAVDALQDRGNQWLGDLQGRIGNWESDPEFEFEVDGEFEGDHEADYETHVSAMMEHLGHQAAQAKTEGEAFAFLAPLAGMALKAVAPKLAGAAGKVMTKGLGGMVKSLFKSGKTKGLVRALPGVVRKTASQIGRQAAAGRPMNAQAVATTLARNAQKTLGDPRRVMQTLQRSRKLDSNVHRGFGGGRQAGLPGRRPGRRGPRFYGGGFPGGVPVDYTSDFSDIDGPVGIGIEDQDDFPMGDFGGPDIASGDFGGSGDEDFEFENSGCTCSKCGR